MKGCGGAPGAVQDYDEGATQAHRPARRRPLLALLLLASLPTVGVVANWLASRSEVAAAAMVGLAVWMLCKAGVMILPAVWHRKVDGGEFGWSPMPRVGRRRALAEAAGAGIAMAAVVLIAFRLSAGIIDQEATSASLQALGLDSWRIVALALFFWVFVNSIVEEYVYRWFVTSQALALSGDVKVAMLISASVFALHHVVGLALVTGWQVALVGGLGVWLGGLVFCWLYLRHDSIWPAWLAHAIVDVAVFGLVGWLALAY